MPTAKHARFTIHIPRKLLAKLGYIANYEGRSKNKEIEMMLMEWIRPCLINGNVHNSERFFRQTRRFDAGILCVFQGKSTQYGGKRSAVWACCPFFKQGLKPLRTSRAKF